MKKLFILIALLAFPLIASNTSWSQDEPEYEFAYGAVVSKAANQVTIAEYNFDTAEEENNVYDTDDLTELDGIGSLEDLVAGDEVEVLYLMEGTRRVAALVAKLEAGEGDDQWEGADETEDWEEQPVEMMPVNAAE